MLSILRCAILSLFVACATASAAMTLSDLTPGKTVHGPDTSLKDLKGKVVFVVYWGTHCPICIGEIPHWEALSKKYKAEGLAVVGLECQQSPAADIETLAKTKGIDYQITTGGSLKGAQISGIPHGFLFGADGKLIEDNPPMADLDKKIPTALKESAAAMAGPGPYTKLQPLAMQIKAGVALGGVLKTLTAKKAGKDATEVAEATMMYDSLHGCAEDQLNGAIEKETEDAMTSLLKFDKLAAQFAGDDIAKKAAVEAAKMRKDPAVKKEIDAEIMWKQIAAMNDNLKPVRGSHNPADDSFRKANMAAIQGMIGGCQVVMQRYKDTAAAKKAQELMDNFK
jgi:thiol-disulfide isomerase/thioredoxin